MTVVNFGWLLANFVDIVPTIKFCSDIGKSLLICL